MAGVKGRSGRRSWDKEAESKQLWNLSVPVLKRALHPRSHVTEDRRIEIALELVKKMLPQSLTHGGDVGVTFTMVEALRRTVHRAIVPAASVQDNGTSS